MLRRLVGGRSRFGRSRLDRFFDRIVVNHLAKRRQKFRILGQCFKEGRTGHFEDRAQARIFQQIRLGFFTNQRIKKHESDDSDQQATGGSKKQAQGAIQRADGRIEDQFRQFGGNERNKDQCHQKDGGNGGG